MDHKQKENFQAFPKNKEQKNQGTLQKTVVPTNHLHSNASAGKGKHTTKKSRIPKTNVGPPKNLNPSGAGEIPKGQYLATVSSKLTNEPLCHPSEEFIALVKKYMDDFSLPKL